MAGPTSRKRQRSRSSAFQQTSTSLQSTPLVPFDRPSLLPKQQRKRHRQEGPSKPAIRRQIQNVLTSQPRANPQRMNSEVRVEEDADESLDHIIMAMDISQRDTIGCAYYVARQERLFCMEDVAAGGNEVLGILKIDIQPTILLVSPRIDLTPDENNPLWNSPRASIFGSGKTQSVIKACRICLPLYVDETALPYRVDFRPSPEFNYEGALNKLANLQSFYAAEANLEFLVPGESSNYDENHDPDYFGNSNRQGRLIQMSASVDMDSPASIGCAGAVITYLQRKRASEFLQDDPAAQLAYRITKVEMFSLKGTMLINPDTLISLQIIQPESHPNSFNQGPGTSGSKESLSIYGLFHHLARTPQGKARLRQHFIRPSLDLPTIIARLDFVSVFVRPENLIALQKLSKSLSRVKNMRTTMALLHKGVSGGNRKLGGFRSGVWASLLEFCYHTIDIVETLKEVLGVESLPLRARAIELLDTFQLQRIGKMVHDIVDLDASIDQHRTVVKRGIDNKLDEIKSVYDGMEELLSQAAVQIARTLPLEVKLNVIYFPQLGFHITIPLDMETGLPVYDGEGAWQTMFTTSNQVYFKDRRMHEMDAELGDLYAMICDIEIELAYDLAQRALQDEALLVNASDMCGELDALLALAHGAINHKLSRPLLVDENVIKIKGGRHLLQEMTVSTYVPNDTFLVGGADVDRDLEQSETPNPTQDDPAASSPNVLLLTGPNYSGKSVYMRSVALTVYLAHVGSFVPAVSARIGLTDKILTRITTRETVSQNQSSFMIELQQVALAITQCTSRSLIVVDEFGKGTDACDGAGLAAGVIRYLLGEGRGPKVLLATHFHEIFEVEGGFDEERGEGLGLGHMEVRVDRNDRERMNTMGTQVTYLYNLSEGRSSISYGTQCASMNGIPAQIVERAARLAELALQGEDLVAVCAAVTEEEEREFGEAEEAARGLLGMNLSADVRRGGLGDGELMDRLWSVLGVETNAEDTGGKHTATEEGRSVEVTTTS